MNLIELQKEIFDINETHGWHRESLRQDDGSLNHSAVLAKLALVHTEIGEAEDELALTHLGMRFEDGKPEGFVVEIADALIRVADTLAVLDIPLKHTTGKSLVDFDIHGNTTIKLRRSVDTIVEAVRVDDLSALSNGCEVFVRACYMLCARYNLDLDAALRAKVRYNRTRPYRHGGKQA